MNIDMIRGDTLNIQFEIEADTALDLQSNDFEITFSLKQAATSTAYVFQKDKTAVTEIGTNIFVLRIAPEDTVDLIPGYYYYDLQLGIEDDIFTIAIGRMHIEIDITRPPVQFPEFPYPDIDDDGLVTPTDSSMVLDAYMNISSGEPSGLTEEQEDLADCNRDGFITAADSALIMSYYSKCLSGEYTNDATGWTSFMQERWQPQE